MRDQLLLVRLLVRQRLEVAHAGQHPDDLLERTHLPDRLQLIAEVVERELVRADLLFEPLRVLDVDRRFGPLDEREHVAHPQHARHDALGMERLQILQPLAAADERDRHADDRHHRQRRAAARVAVELAQHDAGHAHAPVEFAGALDRVLPGHRVGDVEQVGRLGHVLDRDELGHQLVVDVQPARRVDDDDVEPERAGFGERAPRARHRIELAGRIVHARRRLLPDDVQLLDRGRTLDVGRDEQRMASLLLQPHRQLAGRRRLAGALQPEQQDHPRTLRRRLEAALGRAEERHHLVADDLDDLLRRRQAAQDVLPHRAVAHPVDERLDDLEVDVGFEQREPDFPQRGLDVLRRQPRLAPSVLKTSWRRVPSASSMARSSRRPRGAHPSNPL